MEGFVLKLFEKVEIALLAEKNFDQEISTKDSITFKNCLQDDTLTGQSASVDVATKENMEKLGEIGSNLLKNPVSRVNLLTGAVEQVENGGTNEEALKR